MVWGGPYGVGEVPRKGGVGAAVAVLLATPLVWSVPTALMVGERASALPEEGGYYAWVRRALGPFWGFQEAWLSLVASVFDMAIYPTLFTLYLGRVVPSVSSGPGALATGALIIGACTAWNLRGAATVGEGSVALGLAVLAPFVAFAGCAILVGASAGGAVASAVPNGSTFAAGVLIAMWNYMGWDNASTIAEEVHRPERSYPVAVIA